MATAGFMATASHGLCEVGAEEDERMKAKPMSRTLAVEIATKTMTVINPANRGLRVLDLLEKHGFPRVAEPDLDIVSGQDRLVAWLRDAFKTG